MAVPPGLNLPDITTLRRTCQALAMLDAILCEDRDSRYYTFDGRSHTGVMVFNMTNGSGDDFSIVFSGLGAVIKGFAHESPMSPFESDPPREWPGLFDGMPGEFKDALRVAEVELVPATFALWRCYPDESWVRGVSDVPGDEDPDGSLDLLGILTGGPVAYREFAEFYYEVDVPLEPVVRVYDLEPLSEERVAALGSERLLAELAEEADEIRYPRLLA